MGDKPDGLLPRYQFFLRIQIRHIPVTVSEFLLTSTKRKIIHLQVSTFLPSEEFELKANSLGTHMKVTESSPGMGHGEFILRTFI